MGPNCHGNIEYIQKWAQKFRRRKIELGNCKDLVLTLEQRKHNVIANNMGHAIILC